MIDGDAVIEACRATGGTGYAITDEEVFAAQSRLAREEGVFCEPAGAVALAGALQAAALGEIAGDDVAVCLVTGTGFKDIAAIQRMNEDSNCETIDLNELGDRFGA